MEGIPEVYCKHRSAGYLLPSPYIVQRNMQVEIPRTRSIRKDRMYIGHGLRLTGNAAQFPQWVVEVARSAQVPPQHAGTVPPHYRSHISNCHRDNRGRNSRRWHCTLRNVRYPRPDRCNFLSSNQVSIRCTSMRLDEAVYPRTDIMK